jgi:hypothetical protein
MTDETDVLHGSDPGASPPEVRRGSLPRTGGRQRPRVHECESVLSLLEQDVDGFMGAAVVDFATGQPVARLCVQPPFGMSAVIEAAVTAMRAHVAAETAVGAGAVEEMGMSDSICFHFYQLVTPGELLVVSALRSEISFALLRAFARRRAAPLSSRVRLSQPSLRPS